MTRSLGLGLLTGILLFASPTFAADRGKGCCGNMGECAKPPSHGCCAYVACCEAGNRGFFTQTTCGGCARTIGKVSGVGKDACCCNAKK